MTNCWGVLLGDHFSFELRYYFGLRHSTFVIFGSAAFSRHDKNPIASHTLGMVEISVTYTGDLHCEATHGPSDSTIATDAPTDNRGRGESFSPTDLVATALATCMSTTMGIAAKDHGIDLSGMRIRVEKHMSKDAPRRIVGLPAEVHIPLSPDCPQRALLEQTALNCPVHKSLPAEIERPTAFFWEG